MSEIENKICPECGITYCSKNKCYNQTRDGLPLQSVAHTLGPWMYQQMDCQTDKHTFNSEVVSVDGTTVVSIVKKPDARLIAASPELLEACIVLSDAVDDVVQGGLLSDLMPAYKKASLAISKAITDRKAAPQ